MTRDEGIVNSFQELVERFRSSNDPETIKRLGDELGRIVFNGGRADESKHPKLDIDSFESG